MLPFIVMLFVVLFLFLLRGKMDSLSFVTLLLFYSYWCLQLILSQFQINGVYLPSWESTLFLMVGVVFFSLGFYSVRITSNTIAFYKLNVYEKLRVSVEKLIDNKWFILLLLVSSLYIGSLDVYFFNQIAIGQFIRQEGADMAEYYGPTFAKINTYFLSWYIPMMRPVFCYCLLYKRKWYLPLMAILLLGFEILSGGRIGLIRTFIPVILIIGLFRIQKGFHFNLKQIFFFLLIIIGIYYGIVALTAFRLGTTDFESVISDGQDYSNDAIVNYFVGPSVAFDQAIHSNIIETTGGYKFGLNVLWPVFSPVIVVFYLLGFTDYINGPAGAVSDYIQWHYLSVGPGTRWNALYTWNIDFFCDADIIGIIIFNFLFGFLVRFLYKWLYTKGTVYNLIIVSLVFVLVLHAPLKLYGLFNLLPLFLYVMVFLHLKEAKKLYAK